MGGSLGIDNFLHRLDQSQPDKHKPIYPPSLFQRTRILAKHVKLGYLFAHPERPRAPGPSSLVS